MTSGANSTTPFKPLVMRRPEAGVENAVRDIKRWADTPDKGASRLVAFHSLTSVFSTVAAHTTFQDEGLTVTFNEIVGRYYKFTMGLNPYVPGGVNGVWYALNRAGVTAHDYTIPLEATATGTGIGVTFVHFETNPLGGLTTWNLQLRAINNNTQVASFAGPQDPRQLLVEEYLIP